VAKRTEAVLLRSPAFSLLRTQVRHFESVDLAFGPFPAMGGKKAVKFSVWCQGDSDLSWAKKTKKVRFRRQAIGKRELRDNPRKCQFECEYEKKISHFGRYYSLYFRFSRGDTELSPDPSKGSLEHPWDSWGVGMAIWAMGTAKVLALSG
jgi:hypothetical protein